MAITINRATLARQVNNEIEYIYPKTDAELVKYDATQSIKEKIDSIISGTVDDLTTKLDKPVNEDGSANNGTSGQVLETNGDGTTSWVSRPRIYVGSGDMPAGYDAQIDPNAKCVEIDKTLSIEGHVADAKSTGDAINKVSEDLNKVAADVDTNKSNITALQNSLSGSNTNVGNLTNRVSANEGDIKTLQSDMTTAKGNISTLQTDNDKNKTDIENLQTESASNKISVANLTNKVSANITDIALLQTDLNNTKTDVTDLENGLKNTNNNITVLQNNMDDKINKPASGNGNSGQVLETNGDGTTRWIDYARVYVGPGDMPDDYDVQIDPTETTIEIDRTLSIDGGIAEASATGAAINVAKNKITTDIATHNSNAAAHTDIRAAITAAREYILIIDEITGEEYKIVIQNGIVKIKPAVIKCTGITITNQPTKTSYNVGEVFTPAGMIVTASYNDGTSKQVTSYTYPTVGLAANTTSVLITYIEGGITVTASVPVTMIIKCTGITITKQPTKTEYFIGDVFNPAGMVITAGYNNNTTKAVTNYTYPTTGLTAGTTTVAVSYTESGSTFTVNVPVTVIAKCTGITVTTQPTKTSYTEGEVFNPAGMVVTANYNNGTSKQVTNYTYPTSALGVGTTSVMLTYTENGVIVTTAVSISVNAAFDAATVLQDFTYTANADGTYTLTGWKGTKNGVSSTEVVVPNSNRIIVNPAN